jgi:tRNA threonylcarbamoyladenosine biosynthesis protein TsaB
MLLLVIDTSCKNGSVALARVTAGQPEVETIETVPLVGGTFSAQIVPQVSALLAKHGYNKSDLAAFAAVSGPGSFTGLRVGLAAVKALGEVLRKPIAAVSLLEAVAESGRMRGRVLAALDAGRGEIYAGEYATSGADGDGHWRMLSERLLGREELVANAKDRVVVTPDAALADALKASGLEVERVDYPNAHVIARLAWTKILQGRIVAPENLEANYIRRSDAEIFSKPKL